jgi:uncharacterized membrane-anchored protein YjiN (DUF445 family)
MSNTGVISNTFRITGKYLDLLNDFVVKTNVDEEINEGRKEQLVEFFSKLLDQTNAQPQFQLLSSIIERSLRNSQQEQAQVFLNSLINEIKSDDTKSVLPKIEFIIEVLDEENSNALSKIKGD